MSERRENDRACVEWSATLCPEDSDAQREAYVMNVSGGGVGMLSLEACPVGSAYRLTVMRADSGGKLEFRCVAVNCQRLVGPRINAWKVGARLTKTSPELVGWLNSLALNQQLPITMSTERLNAIMEELKTQGMAVVSRDFIKPFPIIKAIQAQTGFWMLFVGEEEFEQRVVSYIYDPQKVSQVEARERALEIAKNG